MSKGSNRRPMAITRDEWERNHARTFGTPNATVAQSEERRSANAEVGGSNPLGRSDALWDAFNRGDMEQFYQLVEHRDR